MKRFITACLLGLLISGASATAQQNSNKTTNAGANTSAQTKRGPIFRANKEQIKQAQNLLKQRGLYGGEISGKLDDDTRAALRKYQEAAGIKVTGTLNRVTLEKMSITLTDKQKAM